MCCGMIRKAVAIILVLGAFASVNAQSSAIESVRGANSAISFYPNPVSETLYIDVNNLDWEDTFAIELIDHIGREIEEVILDRVEVYQIELDVSGHPPGMYFLRIIADGLPIETRRLNIN